MKLIKKTLFIAALFPLLAITSSYSSSDVAERGGGGGGMRGGGEGMHGGDRDHGDYGRYGGYGEHGGYGGYGGYGGGVVYPGYPAGGYLLPGPVDPGEDAADAIYRANQHPPQ